MAAERNPSSAYLCGCHILQAADPAALGVAAWVAARSHDHCQRHLRRPLQLHICELPPARCLRAASENLKPIVVLNRTVSR